jgi:uncharacterized repeat protein (TIGR02543 family)
MKGCALPRKVKQWGLTFFLVVLLLFALASAVNAAPGMMGDVNGDGVIDVRDTVMVMRHVLNQQTLTSSQRELADVNGDGVINVFDVNLITQRSLGLISRFPVPDRHTVSFNGNGGMPALQTRTVGHGDTMRAAFERMPLEPTRSGYSFLGWNTRIDGTGSWFTVTTAVYSSQTVYAQWQPVTTTHTVTFNGNGGTPSLQTRRVSHGSTLAATIGAMPTQPTRMGDTFMGWNTRIDGTGSWFTANTAVYESQTVYAQWQSTAAAHTLIFNGNGGTPNLQTRTVNHGGRLGTLPGAMPTQPTRMGDTFMGWNTRVDGTGSWFTANTPVYSNLDLYAQWQSTTFMHTVTFSGNGGTPASQTRTVYHGGTLGTMPGAMPMQPARSGYSFTGWNTRVDGTGSWFTASSVVYSSQTVYAQWQSVTATHTVTFNGNGGSPASQTMTVNHGGSLGIMPSSPILLGAEFIGWNTRRDGTGSWFTAMTTVYSSQTVYAQWRTLTADHTVTFNGNGGYPAIQTMTASHGSSLGALPDSPWLPGAVFVGWNTRMDGAGSWFTASTPVYNSQTVYAQWEPFLPPVTQ